MGAHPDRHCKVQGQMTTCKWGLHFRLGLPQGLSDKQAPYQCRKRVPSLSRKTPHAGEQLSLHPHYGACALQLGTELLRPRAASTDPQVPEEPARHRERSPRSPRPEKSLSSTRTRRRQRQRKKPEAGGRFPSKKDT